MKRVYCKSKMTHRGSYRVRPGLKTNRKLQKHDWLSDTLPSNCKDQSIYIQAVVVVELHLIVIVKSYKEIYLCEFYKF
jgi:hypothetical protein